MNDKFKKSYDGPDPLKSLFTPGSSDIDEKIVEISQPEYTVVCILKDSNDRIISSTKPFKIRGSLIWKFSVDFSHVILNEEEDYFFSIEMASFWSWPKFFWYNFVNLIKRLLIKEET